LNSMGLRARLSTLCRYVEDARQGQIGKEETDAREKERT
jgi:hypothetical protein